ncbi:MAG: hypothetical protein K2W95_00940 [Candidatus Obscuribacterales bacterium]|nr:hypothetical protein [Candidatus Obscuribacterales bacterium]
MAPAPGGYIFAQAAGSEVVDAPAILKNMRVLITAAALVALALPAGAEDLVRLDATQTLTNGVATPNIPTVDVDVPEKKPNRFKAWCKETYRGCRWVCIKTKPFVDYAGSAANFALLFIPKK